MPPQPKTGAAGKPAAKRAAKGPSKRPAKADTRARLLAATIETLREDGIIGCSARSIARRAAANQALIWYYFDGIEHLIVEAVSDLVTDQRNRYAPRLDEVQSLSELVAVARDLHRDDQRNGSMGVLVQALAGIAHTPELSRRFGERMAPWIELIERTVVRVMADSPAAPLVPPREIAVAINAMFLGSELFAAIDPHLVDNDRLFDTLSGIAATGDLLMRSPLLASLNASTLSRATTDADTRRRGPSSR